MVRAKLVHFKLSRSIVSDLPMIVGHVLKGAIFRGGVVATLAVILGLSSFFNAPVAAKDKGSTVAKDARLGGNKARTRFVADLSKATDYRIFTLADPYRVIIDLPNVNFSLPEGLGNSGKGLVSAFRYGLFAPGKSRIVIDVIGPVHVEQSFILKPKGNVPAKLVVDIVPTDRKNFERRRRELYNKRREKNNVQPASVDKSIEILTREKKHKGRLRVVIDPGHGGLDPGASSAKGSKEKDVVLAFAKVLRKKMKQLGKYDVKLTRTVDVFVPLAERVKIAEDYNASLFVSIHADSISKRLASRTRGATIYTLSKKGSDLEAQAFAKKENQSDVLAGLDLPETSSEVGGILWDLTQRETKNQSLKFAGFAVNRMSSKTKFTQNKMRSANFRVLRSAIVPSVLIELGYISNPEDEKLLKSKKWQNGMAIEMTKAIDRFLKDLN